VFISYSRKDGEDFARDLRGWLEKEAIPLWQDRVGMEGGRDWWLQITEALDQVEFMVLIATPAAMGSPVVRKEWRYARQQGVCVYPVVVPGSPPDFGSMPRWMRDSHFYDYAHADQQLRLLNDLRTACDAPRVPFMCDDLPGDFVRRDQEIAALIDHLLDEARDNPVAITAALRGAGGYGKTTLARAICHDERIQQAFDDGILWVTLGEDPGDLTGRVIDLVEVLSGERPGFSSIEAAITRLAELLADRDLLIVIDDAWNSAHLRPFLQGGSRCARLITTRRDDVLPSAAARVPVDAMRTAEAVELLGAGLEPTAEDRPALARLANRLGQWPLLLKLVNGLLRERVSRGEALPAALDYADKVLARRGLTGFDSRDATAAQRHDAVAKTIGVSLDLLTEPERERLRELAITPEDADVPLAALEKLWGATAGLDDLDSEDLARRLFNLSLLLDLNLAARTIRLHDVIRAYLRAGVGESALRQINARLLDAYGLDHWRDLPDDEPYLWDWLAFHLTEADRGAELIETVRDPAYLARKTHLRETAAVERDLIAAEAIAPEDADLRALKRAYVHMSHLLDRCETYHDVCGTVYSRLLHLDFMRARLEAWERPTPRLEAEFPPPDQPHPNLVRVLAGHTGEVNACAITPDGKTIVSASSDNTLRVWDGETGQTRLILEGHTRQVTGCAVTPDGRNIVSASWDNTLRVWDGLSGECRLVLTGHTGPVTGCAVTPDGRTIVSASGDYFGFRDNTLRVWDGVTGQIRLILEGHTGSVTGCAITPDARTVVSASWDNTLRVWNGETGECRIMLVGHKDHVYGCAITPDGRTIVSASWDDTLRVWDAATGKSRRVLAWHTRPVNGCSLTPDGRIVISASSDSTLRVWDAAIGQTRLELKGHINTVNACAITPNGRIVISASSDSTLRVWDITNSGAIATIEPHLTLAGGITNCSTTPDGSTIVSTSSNKTLRVWDGATGEPRRVLEGHTSQVTACSITSDGAIIVSASINRTLRLWNGETGTPRRVLKGHTNEIRSCAVTPDGRTIVSTSGRQFSDGDNTLWVWETATGECRLILKGHTKAVNGCAITPDGRTIVSASWDRTLRVWDGDIGETRLVLAGHTSYINGCAITSDGKIIVSASRDHTLRVWDGMTGECVRVLTGHTDSVTGCAITPDGRTIISASYDSTLRVWDGETGACLAVFHADAPLTGCAITADGSRIIAGGEAGLYWLRFRR
jgi:WD40 repeat protein